MQHSSVYIIEAEGQKHYIEWSKFKVGSSFFIPCLESEELRKEIKRKARQAHVGIKMKLQTENKIQGLRVWRID